MSSLQFFARNILCGPRWRHEATEVLQKCDHSLNVDGSETIEINGVRIQSYADGTIRFILIFIRFFIHKSEKKTLKITVILIIFVSLKHSKTR